MIHKENDVYIGNIYKLNLNAEKFDFIVSNGYKENYKRV